MTAVWSFMRQYVSESEAWLLLPVLAAVCMAVGSFFFLQSAVEKRSTVTAADKAEWKQKLAEQGRQVHERAKQKADADAAATLANQTTTQQPATDAASTPASDELRQRKGNKTASEQGAVNQQEQSAAAADDSGMTSDNDWELVDDERIERAEDSQYEVPVNYQRAVEAFVETLHETPHSHFTATTHSYETPVHNSASVRRSLAALCWCLRCVSRCG